MDMNQVLDPCSVNDDQLDLSLDFRNMTLAIFVILS